MKKCCFLFVMLLCLTVAKAEAKVVTVTVNTPGTFARELIGQIDSWSGVTELTVKGNINDTDMSCLSRLTSVVKIDLSQTKIKNVCGMNGLKKLTTVVLPTSVIKVNKGAFANCLALKEISMPNVTEIDDEAFDYCQSLVDVKNPAVTSIGYGAFRGCIALTSVDLPVATSIGVCAFEGCWALTSVNIPVATSIDNDAFSGCRALMRVDLPVATSIGFRAFYECSALMSVKIPVATSIGWLAFYGCSALTSVSIPATLRSLDFGAFSGCPKLKDVYCYVIMPLTSDDVVSDPNATGKTLHVPAFCLTDYRIHESWYNFNRIVALEGNLDRVDVYTPFTITKTKGIAEKADLNLCFQEEYGNERTAGHLTVSTKIKWNIGKYVQNQGSGYYCSTMIPANEMTADNVSINYLLREENWNFISFPFDVNVSDIIAPKDVLWVIRRYSGEDRARMTGKTWQNMTKGMALKAGEGYILHYTKLDSEGGSSSENIFTFKAVNNSNKNNIFAYKDVTKPLATYASDLAHNRSWNLVGNPYPCYYDTRCIEHNGVITVWNGSGYNAYSLLDDKYVLQPNEAFFVQCPVGASSMKFKADGRQHEYEASSDASYSNAYRQNSANPRYVYNLSLAGTDYTDKARVVINETAKLDYEISCDASKFMSSNTTVPQLYVMENGQKLAIDERPLLNGTIALGTYFGKTGNYTIALMDNPDYTKNVMLTDLQTNTTVDLTKEAYQFSAVQGSDEERFVLSITDDPTGVGAIINNNSEKATNCYNLSGQQISAPHKGINIVNGKKTLVR